MPICAACGFENPANFRFCGSCGEALGRACANCGAEVPQGLRYCGSCGQSVDSISKAPSGPRLPGERRRATILFADLVGYSTLAEYMDPEDLERLVSGIRADMSAAVESRDGTVERFIGDAVLAAFGVTRAHEDDPIRAVEAAFAMLEAIGQRSEDIPSPFQLRIGVNSGLVVSGERDAQGHAEL